MQISAVSPRPCLGLVAVLALGTLSACTSTSSFTSLSSQNLKAVAQIAREAPAPTPTAVGTAGSTETSEAPAAPADATPSDSIVGTPDAPAQIAPTDPVAIPKPSNLAPPAVLASVPRTPVANRPTNQIMMVRTTAYTHSESDHVQYGRQSAAGNTLKYGSQVRSAAADWSKYPLGTRFKIEGLPYEYVVDDYGSALVGTETIDIYKPEKGTMNKWGVRNVPIRVLEWGSFEESRKILDGRKHVRHADHVREMLHEIEKKAKRGSIPSGPGGTSA